MTFDEFVGIHKDDSLKEKLALLVDTMELVGNARVNRQDAVFRQNDYDAEYYQREYDAMEERTKWIYQELSSSIDGGKTDALRHKIGNRIYFAGYDSSFDEGWVSEYEVKDITLAGLVLIGDDDDWVDPSDPAEQMYWTREEAEKALAEMARKAGENKGWQKSGR